MRLIKDDTGPRLLRVLQYCGNVTEAADAQMRKGLVSLCVMAVLAEGEAYGYAIVQRLEARRGLEFKESSVYLALGRLAKQGHVESWTVKSASGPSRRYFRLTMAGHRHLGQQRQQWLLLSSAVSSLLAEVVHG